MTLSAGDRDDAGSYYYAQLGYIADWTAWGTTAMAVSYYDAEDMVTDGDSASSWSLNLVQNIERYDLDLYMGYTSYEYDDDDNDYQDADSYMIGARWKF